MSELDEQVRRYTADRAGAIRDADAAALVTRASAKPVPGRGWPRHMVNLTAALVLAVIVIAGGIVLEIQLRGLRQNSSATTGKSALPVIPSETIQLDDPSEAPGLVIPFRLADGKSFPPRPRWALPGNRALLLASASDCSTTTIRIVDRTTLRDSQAPVMLSSCYDTPVVLETGSVLFAHHDFVGGNQNQFRDLGTVIYNWSAGKIVRSYPDLSFGFVGGLASPDGQILYTLNPFASNTALDFTDLQSGARLAHIPVNLLQAGLNPGGLALSVDGRTLYVNEGGQLASFDARTGAAGAAVQLNAPGAATSSNLPWSLPAVDTADAKEGFEPGHGITVDPRGHWVALIGADDATTEGVWVLDVKGSPKIVRHFARTVSPGGISFSLDGSVLYLLAGHNVLDVIDPSTGRLIKEFSRLASNGDFFGIAGIVSH